MRPTPEQNHAVALFRTGGDLRINAFAGAGKTSTLRLIAAATERRGIYLAFNSAIAHEARTKFPPHVVPHTIHSYAFHRMRPRFGNRMEKLTGSVNAQRVTELLRLAPLCPAKDCYLTPRMVAAIVKGTVDRFCASAAPVPRREHVPRWGSTTKLSWWRFRGYAAEVARLASRLWERMIDPRADVPLGHDGYLKLWALQRPALPADFILLDEAQDSSGVVIGLLGGQSAQKVYVGDRHQQIYEWRGAVNAMDRVRTRLDAHLTQSFRFGPAIAAAATRVLRVLGERRTVRGFDAIASRLRCDTPEALLCRTNAVLLTRALEATEAGREVAILGGARELLSVLDDVDRLQAGRRVSRPAFFGYRRWSEVVRAAADGEAAELRGLVRLVERHGAAELRRGLTRLTDDESRADLVLATVHKAKGREWNRVAVADDFAPFRKRPHGDDAVNAEDARLFYVALTRAREEVALPGRLRRRFGIVP